MQRSRKRESFPSSVELERSAEALWEGEIVRGSGTVTAGSGSFEMPVSFPRLRGESPGVSTPEELLAASHAVCYAIGLRSVIGRRGGTASRIAVRATVTASKGEGAIRIIASRLAGVVHGLAGIDEETLHECGQEAKAECTISNALAGNVAVSCEVLHVSR